MKALELFKEVKGDLGRVEDELKKVVVVPNETLLTKTSAHLLNAGGKRLRPAFALLAGKTYIYDFERLLPLAVALELIHMASLVHDDVVDNSLTRRNIPTVKAKWGNQVSICTGDFVFGQSLRQIANCKNPAIASILAKVSVKMSEGEIVQLRTTFDAQQSLKDYLFRIKRKTALLISASCELGALAVGASREHVSALGWYGYYLGMAFQITDDILDCIADEKELGKPVGSDLRQGIVTLPIIYALSRSPRKQWLAEIVQKTNKKEGEILEAIGEIKNCGAIEYSLDVSNRYLNKAKRKLEILPASNAKKSLALIADFINIRKY